LEACLADHLLSTRWEWVVSKIKQADRFPKLLKKLAAAAKKHTQSPFEWMGFEMDSLMFLV
jgi:hypothetical protein